MQTTLCVVVLVMENVIYSRPFKTIVRRNDAKLANDGRLNVALSASEIRSQHEMVVLSHLQSGSMDGGCKRRLIILLADAQVLAPQGAVSVVGLQPGFELRSRRGLRTGCSCRD